MFETECSDEKREILAAINGKSTDECFYEWSRQFRLDFLLRSDVILKSASLQADGRTGKYAYECSIGYFDTDMIELIRKCGNIEVEMIQHSGNGFTMYQYPRSINVIVYFYEQEVDVQMKKKIDKKIRHNHYI